MKKWCLFFFILPIGLFAQHTIPISIIRGQSIAGSVQRINIGSANGMVIFFTGTRCPYDELYRNRMEKLAERFRDQIVFVRLNAMPGEDLDEIARQSNAWKSIFYVMDSAQVMFRKLGAKKTTEVFLLHRRGENLELYYRGPIDDNPQVEHDANKSYLEQAILNLLQDKPSPGHIDRIPGCLIRSELQNKN